MVRQIDSKWVRFERIILATSRCIDQNRIPREGSNMLNVSAAIAYNKAHKYNQQAIGVIQIAVGAMTTGNWDPQAVQAVYGWQKSKNGKIAKDGMVGPETLGYLIGDLEFAGRSQDASVLRQFPHKLISLGGGDAKVNPVVQFTQFTMPPFQIIKYQNYGRDWWRLEGALKVTVRLNPLLSEDERLKYEYRQYIRGSAWLQDGEWNPQTQTWSATSQKQIPISDKFAIPPSGGLPKGLTHSEKEDGMLPEVGTLPIKFGYRDTDQIVQDGFVSAWIPDGNGGTFMLKDTIGYTEEHRTDPQTKKKVDSKIHLEMYFRGVIVETIRNEKEEVVPVREVQSKSWHYLIEEHVK